MFKRILDAFAGNYNAKAIKKMETTVRDINHLYTEYDALTDEQIKVKTPEFKERIAKGEKLDDLLPEAFAVVKQACKRMVGNEYEVKGEKVVWNMIPYDVQLIGGIILHQGKIAEMKTWEWKTLVATMPVYLNALSGKGVHVVTVNDYLASRDAQWMGHLYEWLGLSIWTVVKSTPLEKRREAYLKDITYMENSELGFDYLRDNLLKTKKNRAVLARPLHFAIVDEIDSILIDEARTPLIISEGKDEPTEKYEYYRKIIQNLTPCNGKKPVSKWFLQELLNDEKKPKNYEEDGDYYIDEKTKTVSLSGLGIQKLENILGVKNLYKDIGYEEIHHIENALRAKAVYEKDKEYIVKGGEVLIVDEHTGRTMPGRRFSEGLHQAIEAKELVNIQRESQTVATITYQNFFRQYEKLAGMTGTAMTEGEEFNKIYDLEALEVPTNRELIRVDQHDKVYFNQKAKRNFVKNDIKFYHQIGQPILIGTANIQTSEYLSSLLDRESINHYVLNAKFFEQEANIVANAGKFKSVVVATNMAWRWTDIKLEDGLNQTLAVNYAKWIKKTLENYTVKATMYSEKEFEYTLAWLKTVFWLTEEQITQAEKEIIVLDENIQFSINFNRWKKERTDRFVTLIFKYVDWNPVEEKDFHYGLFVMGTEKHESRRIDNQLRGRAGRQWDAGRSVFYVALDDLIMRKVGGETIQNMVRMLLWGKEVETLELTQKQFTNSIERAQKQMEAWHFSTRKHLFDYDSIIDKQRQRVYHKRDLILDSEDDSALQKAFVKQGIQEFKDNLCFIVEQKITESDTLDQSKNDLIMTLVKELSLQLDKQTITILEQANKEQIPEIIMQFVETHKIKNMEKISQDTLYLIFKDVFLHHLDKLWVEHIDTMQYLRDKVGFMGYAQQDPLVVYKKESFEKFQYLNYNYKFETTLQLMNIDFVALSDQENLAQSITMEENGEDQQFISKLKNISSNIQSHSHGGGNLDSWPSQEWQRTMQPLNKKVFFQDEDWVEVFEVEDSSDSQTVQVVNTKKKLRPNDKVTVKYVDGKIEYDVKYKKVKDDVEAWKCEIIG